MHRFRFFLVGISVILLSWCAEAQVPGYLGKRFVLSGHGISSPAISNPSAGNRGWRQPSTFRDGNGRLGINLRFGGEASYVVARHASLFLGYDYQKTGMIHNAIDLDTDDFYNLFSHLRTHAVTFGVQRFRSEEGALAPFGLYRGVHLTRFRATGDIQEIYSGNTSLTMNQVALGTTAAKSFWFIGYSFGINYILADRYVLNISGQINLPLHLRRSLFVLSNSSEFRVDPRGSNLERNQAFFNEAAFERLMGQSLFLMKIGAGYLLF